MTAGALLFFIGVAGFISPRAGFTLGALAGLALLLSQRVMG